MMNWREFGAGRSLIEIISRRAFGGTKMMMNHVKFGARETRVYIVSAMTVLQER
jgi:hypothetical protein